MTERSRRQPQTRLLLRGEESSEAQAGWKHPDLRGEALHAGKTGRRLQSGGEDGPAGPRGGRRGRRSASLPPPAPPAPSGAPSGRAWHGGSGRRSGGRGAWRGVGRGTAGGREASGERGWR